MDADTTEEELIQEYEDNASKINSLWIELEEARNTIEEREEKLKDYIDNAYKAKELGEELSYYKAVIHGYNVSLVRESEHVKELEWDYNRKKEINDELTLKLKSLGYVYSWGIRADKYGLPYTGHFWVKPTEKQSPETK